MRCFVCTLCVIAAALCAAPAFAQMVSFTGSGGSYYSPTTGWTSSTTAYIGYEATGTPAYGTMTVTNGYTQNSATAYLGGYSSSYPNVTGNAYIDGTSGATPSSWNLNGSLYVGDYGPGNLSVTNGASVSSNSFWYFASQPSSTATVTVDGMASATSPSTLKGTGSHKNYYIGDAAGASATLNITNGGYANPSGGVLVGSSGSGTLNVNGVNAAYGVPSKLSTTGTLSIGGGTAASVSITNGGLIACGSGSVVIANGGPASVTVTGAGSTLSGGEFVVGSGGVGSLTIANGGTANTSNSLMLPAGGTATVTGPASTMNVNSGIIDLTGGTLVVENGGAVTNNDYLTMTGGAVVLRGGAALSTPNASFSTGSGGPPGASIDAGSSLKVSGGVSYGVQVVAGAGAAAGTYAPVSAGTFSGTFVVQPVGGAWNTSTEQFTVSSPVSGTSGTAINLNTSTNQQRAVLSDAAGNTIGAGFLAGNGTITPTITALGSASGPSGLAFNQFVLEDWGLAGVTASSTNPVYLSLSGNPIFANETVYYSTNGGGTWLPVTTANAADLYFDGTYENFNVGGSLGGSLGGTLGFAGYDYAVVGTPALPGDANLDGRVDINDLTVVLTNYNHTGQSWSTGDFIGDGTVDINDLTIVLTNYNTSVASGSPAALSSVPEPASLLLLAAGLVGLLAWAWRELR